MTDKSPIVLIDSSYFNFYRFTATQRWYNYDPERVEAAVDVEWANNPIFMTTFEKMWFETITKLAKKLGVKTSDLIFARDGANVWRYEIFPEYKAARAGPAGPMGPSAVFKVINSQFHKRLGVRVLRVDQAEADDIIAITARYIQTVFPEREIVVITGDHDLLQIVGVRLYKLCGGRNIIAEITANDPHIAKMTKILAGDPSDGIPQAFPKVGKVTARKIAEDPELLEQMIEKYGREQYDLNCTLVNFEHIPKRIVKEIEECLDTLIS